MTQATPERTDYLFLLPMYGSLEATARRDVVDCDPWRGAVSDPSRTGQPAAAVAPTQPELNPLFQADHRVPGDNGLIRQVLAVSFGNHAGWSGFRIEVE